MFALLCLFMLCTSTSYAACSPGIPCTTYNIYDNPNAGTDNSLNALKAGTIPPTDSTCDGNFMNQIIANAYMGASREVIMAQQLIHKPDSVLEYTCFDQFLNIAANSAGSFTETTNYQNRNICLSTADTPVTLGAPPTCSSAYRETINAVGPNLAIDNALNILIVPQLTSYINANFSHTFLGEATTVNNNIGSLSAGSAYNCAHMGVVWDIAQCIDFGEDDRFRTFADLVAADPRTIPAACSPNRSDDSIEAGAAGNKVENAQPFMADPTDLLDDPCPVPASTAVTGTATGLYNDLLRLASNCDQDSSKPNAYSKIDSAEAYDELTRGVGTFSDLRTYIPGTGNVAGIFTCALPIPTGVPVFTYRIDSAQSSSGFASSGSGPGGLHEINRELFISYDHICPNPGCYFQGVQIPYLENDAVPSPDSIIPGLGTTLTGVCVPY